MNKELYVSSTPHETKVALVEDDLLAEVFFERENEYTLAGSIYKGRVTRVLPGMQSAFVDIGLERDAFLYVSDFLELPSEEDDDEEFGQIPAPRIALDMGKSQPVSETHTAEASVAEEGIEEEESESADEELSASAGEEPSSGEVNPTLAGTERDNGEGSRRWRGRRRRRGGRRGRPDERDERPEQKIEAVKAPEEAPAPRVESRPRMESSPPSGFNPMVLPGESISKYRDRGQPAEQEPVSAIGGEEQPERAEPESRWDVNSSAEAGAALPEEHAPSAGETEEVVEVIAPPPASDEHKSAAEKPWWLPRWASSVVSDSHEGGAHAVEPIAAAAHEEHDAYSVPRAEMATDAVVQQAMAEQPTNAEPETAVATSGEETRREESSAAWVASKGHTLEHEVLEDEEAEFHPVPDDMSALSEVAGDEELVLEEETLDSDNGYSERWIPKIEEVDEDEVVAAEMRGENIYEAGEAEEEDEQETADDANGRAELRAAPPTAAYQQRQTERPGYNRQYRDRNRRGGGPRRGGMRPRMNRNQPLISDLLKEGQEVLIQIAKEPIAKKGARITSHIALPGRFLVYMPTVNHVGVSRKIASDEERQRLKRIVTSERENGIGGFIVRTAAANIKEDELRADIRFLKHLWAEIKNRAENSKSPALIYHDLNLVERVLRDQVNADFSQIWVDTEDEYERVVRFAHRFQPSLVRRIKLYTKDAPLFEHFGIQEEINRSLKSKVWLKSGGYWSLTRPKRWWRLTSTPANMSAKPNGWKTPS